MCINGDQKLSCEKLNISNIFNQNGKCILVKLIALINHTISVRKIMKRISYIGFTHVFEIKIL